MVEYSHERRPKREFTGPPPEMPPLANDIEVVELACAYLRNRGLHRLTAGANGWYPTRWDVPRLVIPCTNTEGSMYFQARRMDKSDELRYRSPRAPESAIRDALVVCRPLYGARPTQAVITEGPLDALAAACAGFVGVGLMGNQPPIERLGHVVAKFADAHEPFLIVPDLDSQEFGVQLQAFFALQHVTSALVMPTRKDLCEMLPRDRVELLVGAVKRRKNVRRKSTTA